MAALHRRSGVRRHLFLSPQEALDGTKIFQRRSINVSIVWCPMFQPRKILFLSAVCTACLVTATSAVAFSIPAPAENQARGSQAARSAYSVEAAAPAEEDGMLLSAQEIQHIRWCAGRYLSYHATDNTYLSPKGKREECRSPL
jgi:hypothetical protein